MCTRGQGGAIFKLHFEKTYLRSDTSHPAQLQKMASGLKFRIEKIDLGSKKRKALISLHTRKLYLNCHLNDQQIILSGPLQVAKNWVGVYHVTCNV